MKNSRTNTVCSQILAHFALCLADPIFIFSYSIPAANWGWDTIYIALPMWFLIRTDQDGQKILCSGGLGIDFGRERRILMMMQRRKFQIYIPENSESDSDYEDEPS